MIPVARIRIAHVPDQARRHAREMVTTMMTAGSGRGSRAQEMVTVAAAPAVLLLRVAEAAVTVVAAAPAGEAARLLRVAAAVVLSLPVGVAAEARLLLVGEAAPDQWLWKSRGAAGF